MASSGNPMIGQILDGRWEILALIGSSTFGEVYEGRALPGGQPCAIKMLRSGLTHTGHLADFEVEGDLLELLAGSSNIIAILDRGRHSLTATVPNPTGEAGTLQIEIPYIVLELADASLADLIAQRHQLPWGDRLALFRDVTKGMHQMHSNWIVNRDLKSDNALILEVTAKINEAKISDLGRSSDTKTPARVPVQRYEFMRGDPAFSAPELIWGLGDASPETARLADLYLLGSLLFEFGCGVGLTALAVPDPRAIGRGAAVLSLAERQRSYQSNMGQLRGALEAGYGQFEVELPGPIRQPAMDLLRHLTDVDPQAREPSSYSGRPLNPAWNLQWLLRRTDNMIRLLAVHEREQSARKVKAERREKSKQSGQGVRA
jgi:serine/threonine protein kinase